MSNFLADIAGSAGLRAAALIGFVGLLIGIVAWALMRNRPAPPIGGALVAAAALPVLWNRFPTPTLVIVGCLAMGVGSLLGTTIGERFVGNLIGAYVIVFAVGTDVAIHPVITGAAIALCAALVADHDDSFRRAASTMPLFLGSAVGVLLTVPDTERAMVLVGAAVPLALLGWPGRLGSFGSAGAAAIGVLGYISIIAVRGGAVVGGLLSLGLLLVEPLGRRLSRRAPTALHSIAATRRSGFYAFVLIHGVIVFGASRVAGLRDSSLEALLLAMPFLLLGVVISAAPGPKPAPVDSPSSAR